MLPFGITCLGAHSVINMQSLCSKEHRFELSKAYPALDIYMGKNADCIRIKGVLYSAEVFDFKRALESASLEVQIARLKAKQVGLPTFENTTDTVVDTHDFPF